MLKTQCLPSVEESIYAGYRYYITGQRYWKSLGKNKKKIPNVKKIYICKDLVFGTPEGFRTNTFKYERLSKEIHIEESKC